MRRGVSRLKRRSHRARSYRVLVLSVIRLGVTSAPYRCKSKLDDSFNNLNKILFYIRLHGLIVSGGEDQEGFYGSEGIPPALTG